MQAYPDLSRDELLDGLGDLENYGLVKSIGFIGSPPRYQLEEEAYAAFDPAVMGWDPKEDAEDPGEGDARDPRHRQRPDARREAGMAEAATQPGA